MHSFFASLVLGHLVGDFLLQGKWMAINKSKSTPVCLLHCVIYTGAVTLATWPFIHGWQWSLLIFLSHFPIDRWSLADRWLQVINGRSNMDFIKSGHKDIPNPPWPYDSVEMFRKNYYTLKGGFTAVVYVVVDATMHLVLMYYGVNLLTELWIM